MDAFSLEMTQNIEKTVGINAQASSALKECAQGIESITNPGSALCTQLSTTQRSCTDLIEGTNLLGPKFRGICESIGKLEGKEDGLSEQMKDFSNMLSDVKRQAEVSMWRPAEKHENELRVQKYAAELKTTLDTLKMRDQGNETTKKLLLEAKEAAEKAEARASNEATEKSDVQERLQRVESDIRAELGRASVIARDQAKAKFEQQIHQLAKDKEDKEKDLEKIEEELEMSKTSLVMSSVY